ncbi:MAG: phosphate ABC transporter permease PstA [Candidatus Odinarchaeia archaeon]
MINKKTSQKIAFWILRITLLFPLVFLGWIIGDIFIKGLPRLTPQLLFGTPTPGNVETWGIGPAIIGTLYVMLFTIIISFPLGVLAAIYLTEYAGNSRIVKMIRSAITTLAGVPSIVYGVFGYALFVFTLGIPKSAIAAALTLSLMTLPVIISTAQEALLSVPKAYREAALALGATKWATIKDHVLPNAIGGIMTGAILGLSRAGGETAPILFVYAVGLSGYVFSPLKPSMALPFTIYNLTLQSTNLELTLPIAYAACVVLLIIVLSLNAIAIYVRRKARKKLETQRVG